MALGANVVNNNPAEDTETGSGVGVESSQHRTHSPVQGRTAVKAVPSKPNEDGTDENKCRVVGTAMDLVALRQALSENEGVGKSGPARGNVNWTTTLLRKSAKS